MENISIIQMGASEWEKDWASLAHQISFDEKLPQGFSRIDFALLIVNEDTQKPAGFATVRELDSESVYWQYGGAFPGTTNTLWVVRVYEALIDWCRARYKRVTTLVSNQNVRYLKLCMKFGFRIIGVRLFKNEVFVELLNEFEGGESVCGQC